MTPLELGAGLLGAGAALLLFIVVLAPWTARR